MTLLKHAMLSMYYHRDESNNDANKAVKKATHRVTRSQLDFVDKMYQISFHCEHLGRYFRGNKRRLTWCFGFSNVSAIEQGLKGRNCRGEEHVVELLWSLRSGKTRILWNQTDISNYFVDKKQRDDMVHFTWKTPAGETLQIVAHADELKGQAQYELLVDGVSFSHFPTVAELGARDSSPVDSQVTQGPQHELPEGMERVEVSIDDLHEPSDLGSVGEDLSPSTDDADFRLAMVGLNPCSDCQVVDELHSDLYSPMLESLRRQVVDFLPQLEDIISRAIMHAFFVDTDSQEQDHVFSSSSLSETDPDQIEVNTLWEAYQWMNGHNFEKNGEGDPRLSFMQKTIDSLFVLVRKEDILPAQAARIILSVACLLRLKFANSMLSDTVVFLDMEKRTSEDDLHARLIAYGTPKAVAVAPCRGFGFCRFEDDVSAAFVYQAAEEKRFTVLCCCPTTILLTDHVVVPQPSLESKKEVKIENAGSKVGLSPRTNSIPHLMAPLGMGYALSHAFSLSPPTQTKDQRPGTAERTCSLSSTTDSDNDHSHLMSPSSTVSMVSNRRMSEDHSHIFQVS